MKSYFYIAIFLIACLRLIAQEGVGINTGTSLAHESAMLEVQSTTKGLLIPRISLLSRPLATAVPAGLMIYNTTDKVFNYSNGSDWIVFPVAYISQIQDDDLDTKVSAENAADEDKLRFATGQSGSSVEVAQISKAGIDLNYNSGSEYRQATNRVVAQNKTSKTLASGTGSYPLIENSTLPNTIVGSNIMTTSPVLAGSNVISGAGAGNVLTSTDNTIIGYNSAKLVTSGTKNTTIGTNALNTSVIGNANTIIGADAGAAALNDSLILIGADAGSALTTGRNNLIIGSNLQAQTPTSNNVVILGNKITADAETKKVSFHNLYSFPGSAGSNGDLLVLNASNELEWGGRVSRQVAGAMADIKPFDVGMSTASKVLGDVYFMKVTSFATAELAYIATRIATNTLAGATATLELGIYDATSTAKLASVSKSISDTDLGEIQLTFPSQVSVTSGQILYIAIYCSDNTNVTFPYITTSYSSATVENLGSLPAFITLPGTTNNDNIFVNAY